ncbi:MAG: branched-chain amino acid ABC transporter permease [Deltaproteobacteria bacterium]|nr:branched-chain amino acid ABC transporter permease [Deltaproteobacteria bacterium]
MLQILAQNVLNALQLGSVYALIALGYTMVYGILTMINFAHGDIFMVSAYLALAGAVFLMGLPVGLPLFLVFTGALLFSMLLTAFLGVTIERLAYRPLRAAPRVSAVITALGVGLFLENFTLGLLGPEPRHFPSLIKLAPWEVAGLTITPLQVLIVLLAAALMIALDLLVRRSLLGMAMRAISYNRPIVPLMGVSVDRVISLTFAIGSAIAAAGGLMYALAYPVLDPYMGIRIGWWAFIAAVVGGIGNIRGAMLGGFILGTVEVFTPLILPSSTYRDFVAFSLLLLLLVFKPTGLLGRPVFERV